jgi:excisionase family DNA binding protein
MNLYQIDRIFPFLSVHFLRIDKRVSIGQNATILKIWGRNHLRCFMTSAETRLLTASELAEIFQVSRDEIYKLAKRGTIPAYKIGGCWRFELPQVKERLKRQTERENGLDS